MQENFNIGLWLIEVRHLLGCGETMGLLSVVHIINSIQALGWGRMSSFKEYRREHPGSRLATGNKEKHATR